MKITKGQLKRIIAEEHALVYGKSSKKTNRKSSRRVRGSKKVARRSLQERRILARRRQEILLEARAQLIAEKMLQESWLTKAFAGIKGALTAGGTEIADLAGKVAAPIKDAKNKVVAAYKKSAEAEENESKKKALAALPEEAEKVAGELYKDFAKQLAKALTKAGYEEEEAMSHIAGQAAIWQAVTTPK